MTVFSEECDKCTVNHMYSWKNVIYYNTTVETLAFLICGDIFAGMEKFTWVVNRNILKKDYQ